MSKYVDDHQEISINIEFDPFKIKDKKFHFQSPYNISHVRYINTDHTNQKNPIISLHNNVKEIMVEIQQPFIIHNEYDNNNMTLSNSQYIDMVNSPLMINDDLTNNNTVKTATIIESNANTWSSQHITTKYIGIVLTQDKITIIETDQFHKLGPYRKWYAIKSSDGFYAATNINNRKVFMHNLLMDHDPQKSLDDLTVDHKNRNGLDNRTIKNLRTVDKKTQAINRGIKKTNRSGISGVRYNAPITKNGFGSWIAFWQENKITKTKSFSVAKYGDDIAYEKCVAYRMIKEIFLPDYKIALCLDEVLDYLPLDETIYSNPDVTIIGDRRQKNKSGHKNICFINRPGQRPYWCVRYYENSQRKSKNFIIFSEHMKDEIKKEAIEFEIRKRKYGKNIK